MNIPSLLIIASCQEYNWQSLTALRGAEQEVHYSTMLRELGKEKGMLGPNI